MKIPKELIEQWVKEDRELRYLPSFEYIAQRAAEWALQQPVSMEPVAWKTDDIELYVREDKFGFYDIPLYTATQLAAARQQGAEEERKKTDHWQYLALDCNKRIAELEAELKIGRQNSFDGAVAAKRITEIEHHRNECERQLQASFDANVTLQDRIAELEKSNAQLLEALKMMGTPSPAVFLPHEIELWQNAIAAAEVKP